MTMTTETEAGLAAEKALTMLGYSGNGHPRDNDGITLETLADLRELVRIAEDAMWHQAEVLRNGGESTPAIGKAMGISKQAVHKRLTRA